MLVGSGAVPHLGNRYSGTKNDAVGAAKFDPPLENRQIPRSKNFNQNVRVNQDGHSWLSRSSRVPRLRSRIYASGLSNSWRPLRMPTMASMAVLRSSSLGT